MNSTFRKNEVSEITIELLEKVIKHSYKIGHKNHAPLGCSGDTFLLYGKSREKEISLRLHSGDVKLLITDAVGSFLFYGGYDYSLLPASFIAEQYYNVIQNVKQLLDNTEKSKSITQKDKEKMFKYKRQVMLLHTING